jgi:serpin B
VLLAVGIPWTISALQSDAPARDDSAPFHRTPGVQIVARQGSAYELRAVRHASEVAANAPGLAQSEQEFTLALLQHLHSPQNTSISPASLAIALSMLEQGAHGATLQAIAHALGTSGLSPAQQSAGWQALTEAWAAAAKDGSFSLSSANSLWLEKGLPVRRAFLSALASYYASGTWQVDFSQDSAANAINAWTKQHTNGRIAKLFNSIDPSTVLVLANAVYFQAAWATPFLASYTHPSTFTLSNGAGVQTPFMSATEQLACATTPDYQAVQLPYRGGRFAALAIMPTHESLSSYLDGLSASSLHAVVNGLQPGTTQLEMPKFTVRSFVDLVPTLKQMGMGAAFDGADFSALSPESLQVSQVVQRDYLRVAEKGTEAAAATGIGMTTGARVANTRTIALDHPFLFLIRDTRTGAILFAAQIQNPAAS